MILVKILKVLTSLLFFKTDRDIMFDDVLNRKQCFLYYSKNTLSSIEPMGLADKFCCVICHNVNTQNIKIARRDRPHILVSHRCETFENLLHIDIAPVRRTLSEIILHSKK